MGSLHFIFLTFLQLDQKLHGISFAGCFLSTCPFLTKYRRWREVRQRAKSSNDTHIHNFTDSNTSSFLVLQVSNKIITMGYVEILDGWGETILAWADPDDKFRGYTEVRI